LDVSSDPLLKKRTVMKEISRHQAIENIRSALWELMDGEDSVCKAVTDRAVFCGGFSQWSFEELKQRFSWYVRYKPGIDRARLERFANTWQRSRQHRPSGRLSCDVPLGRLRNSPCAGWEEFYEADLARFHHELCGEEVQVVPYEQEVS
jgi:hypothetical protein